jgi:hypothetical protein
MQAFSLGLVIKSSFSIKVGILDLYVLPQRFFEIDHHFLIFVKGLLSSAFTLS